MIMELCPNILLFEDDKSTQQLIIGYISKTTGAKIRTESTLLNADIYLKSHLIENFDVIICDWMFPIMNAESKLREFRDCGKPVIFYTCLGETNFLEKVYKHLGEIPKSFYYHQKGTFSSIAPMVSILEKALLT